MLQFHGSSIRGPIDVSLHAARLPDSVDWIDAFDPSEAEREQLQQWLGVPVPTLQNLFEIETSSRLSAKGHAIVMSLPMFVRDSDGYPVATPIGFVITPEHVLTMRYQHLSSFEHMVREVCGDGGLSPGGLGATASLLEFLVDHLADVLERMGGELDTTSRSIFNDPRITSKHRRPHESNAALTGLLQNVGRSGDSASKISETLLGLSRIPPFLIAKANPDAELKVRFETILADTKSLHEYQEHLSNKTQFLLDTLLGLANIEQNNVFRVLTVVSVIGIPPTFFASMYGMNFKTIPEYDWSYGYAYGLTVIILSAVIPAVWFKVKGWW